MVRELRNLYCDVCGHAWQADRNTDASVCENGKCPSVSGGGDYCTECAHAAHIPKAIGLFTITKKCEVTVFRNYRDHYDPQPCACVVDQAGNLA